MPICHHVIVRTTMSKLLQLRRPSLSLYRTCMRAWRTAIKGCWLQLVHSQYDLSNELLAVVPPGEAALASQPRVTAIRVMACAAAAAAASVRSRSGLPSSPRLQQVAEALLAGEHACGRTSPGCQPPAPRGRSEHTSSNPSDSCTHTPDVRAQLDVTGCLHCGPPEKCACRPSRTHAIAL